MEEFVNAVAAAVAATAATAATAASHRVLAYVAIGCANNRAQQWPPFLAGWNHVSTLLIDPRLEDPPLCVTELLDTASQTKVLLAERTSFQWRSTEFRVPMAALMRLAVAEANPSLFVVVQDYSGADLTTEFEKFLAEELGDLDPARVRGKVLFDPSHDGPTCFPDLTIPLLRDPVSGLFLTPATTPLLTLKQAGAHPSILNKQRTDRSALLRYYAGRLLRGEFTDESLAAYAAERVRTGLEPLVCCVGGCDVRHVIEAVLQDFIRASGLTAEEQAEKHAELPQLLGLCGTALALTQYLSALCRECP